jgi:hypothetical protein
MPCDGSLTPADLLGKLNMLRGRAGLYRKLALQHGHDGRLTGWLHDPLWANCNNFQNSLPKAHS